MCNRFKFKEFFATNSFEKVIKSCKNRLKSMGASNNIQHCYYHQTTPSSVDSAYFSYSWDTRSREISNKISNVASTVSRHSSLVLSTKIYSSECLSPKKKVSIIMPRRDPQKNLNKCNLKLGNVLIISPIVQSYSTLQDISSQVNKLKHRAKCQLMGMFPSITITINHFFSDNTRNLLESMNASMICNLIYNIRTLLFSPLLPSIQSLDLILFMVIKFLQTVSLVVGCDYLHQMWEELYEKCKNYEYQHWVEYLPHIRRRYVDMWCRLITGDLRIINM